jgi:tetratricopeptide (TPR) repeat protein
MPYDLFVSYSRRDNRLARVTQLVDRIKVDFFSFAGRRLEVFLDLNDIQGMDDWQQKIRQSLRESQLFLAVLSPNYLASPYCRWEWEDYVRYEAMRQCLSRGIAPVYFASLPDATARKSDQALARWIDEIEKRQAWDLRSWHEAGEPALLQADTRNTLEQLQISFGERLERLESARRSPDNLIKHNPAFVGRVRELTELRNALVLNKLGVVGARERQEPGRAIVQGLGGMGKTELALAYAHAFAWDYPGGRWQVGCEHIGDLRAALLQLAGPLEFEFTDDENKSLALGFERVLRELNRRERCLLLLDNVSDTSIFEPEHLDRLPRDRRVDLIATTRLTPHNIPGSAQAQTFIAVDELPEEDALGLMRGHQSDSRFPNPEQDDQARAIVKLLGGFTLAVETAAIYLGRQAPHFAMGDYAARLRLELLPESEATAADPAVAVRHREKLLERTLAVTFETLSAEQVVVLTLAALLPAEQIALPWLRYVGSEIFTILKPTSKPGGDDTWQHLVDSLLSLRLLQTGSDVHVVRMHRLVQELTIKGAIEAVPIVEPAFLEHIKSRADFLVEAWVHHEHRWELEPLAACAWQFMERGSRDGPYLANQAFHPLYSLGRLGEAEALIRRVIEIDEKRLGENHPDLASAVNNLGQLLQYINRLSEAEPLMRRALAIDEQSFGPNHPNVGRDLNNLATLLQTTNRLSEAEALMRRGLAIDELNYGADHPMFATHLNNLASLFLDTNRLAEAEPLMRRVLEILETSFGRDHPDVGRALNNLAHLLRSTNRLAKAEPLMHRVVEIFEKSFGAAHPNVAVALDNLAQLLKSTNRLAEAEPLIRRALDIHEQNFGPDHPDVATNLSNLAQVLESTNRLSGAEPLYRRALAIDEQSFGPNHPKVAKDLNNLAVLLTTTNRHSEAEPLIRRALDIDEKGFGPDHPDVARDLNTLALLLEGTNRLAEAEPLLRRALAIDEQSLGPDHPLVAAALNNLAQLFQDTNRMGEAEPMTRRALAIDEQSFGPNHPKVAIHLNNLGQLLQAMNRFEEVEPLMRRALAIDKESFGSDHPEVATDLNNLASLLYDTNRVAEAEPLMRQALAIDEQSFGADHPKVAADLNRMALLLQAMSRLAEAEPLAQRTVEILLRFTVDTGHEHPHLQIAIARYKGVLQQMGRSEQEIQSQLNAVGRPFGIQLGGKLDSSCP